jgi:hypothetical protein
MERISQNALVSEQSYQINEKHGTYFFVIFVCNVERHADIKQQHDSIMSRTVQVIFFTLLYKMTNK